MSGSAMGARTVLRSAAALAFTAAVLAMHSAPAAARTHTSVSLHVGIPLYAGPPAYYYGPYYAPTYYAPPPVYYPPPPVIVVPAPTAVAPCRSGVWRQIDGSFVNGIACLQANGTWRLTSY